MEEPTTVPSEVETTPTPLSIPDVIRLHLRNSSLDPRLKLEVVDSREILSRITNDIVPQAVDRYLSARNYYNVTSAPAPDAVSLPLNETQCVRSHIPAVGEYLAAINVGGIAVCSLGALVVITILVLYVDTLKHILHHVPSIAKTNSVFVISVYPVVAIVTYCAIVVPRAHLLAEAITQGMFMACLYQLFCLFIAYAGGESELIRRTQSTAIIMQVPPCCCYPCCSFLPTLAISKRNVKLLRLLVLQLPVVQGLVYLILLVMWAEEESLYQVNYLYLQPVVIASILSGVWGMIMMIRMVSDSLPDYKLQQKFVCLQLVLVLAKLQGLVLRICVWADLFPCRAPVTSAVYANLLYNSAMLWEMMILCSFARMLYKKYLPEVYFTKPVQFPRHIIGVIDKLAKEDLKNDRTREDTKTTSARDKF
nr:PREDICTED: organic solute transporter alpha-like protein [Bemisia tabaci]XP_018899980.1 PREDICTED: organic solute transporter alpha-like protein [Bemisia tabaci]XP_018899981.1 PREDICTED: organic solute transporter alpha-like protein [Bemisia tabaci]XP_018899982.1 PREDICTED: organic solute transporter alpha-like protein [Bemisia tabaci]XP_018899983.1 PREDICTED: organic solute transporter alpha-like protein [Bemisia tabaci]